MCKQSKALTWALIGPLHPLETSSYPFEQVTMNLITHLPTSERFDSVFTIVDSLSKYVTFILCKDTCTDPEIAKIFYNHIVCKFGMPKKVVSDKDNRFLSNILQALICLLWYTLAMSSGYHPQTDGQSE